MTQIESTLPEANQVAVNSFAQSETFGRLFTECMSLVEETASYLDGPGRLEASTLPRKVALAYAGESMRVTTCLMQVASWSLVQRAIKEGEMTPNEAAGEKYRLSAQEICLGASMDAVELLPEALLDLKAKSEAIYIRINRLDEQLFTEVIDPNSDNPVHEQLSALADAFKAPE